MSSTEVTETEVEEWLVKLKEGDIDKKVNLIQFWGLKLETATSLPDRSFDAITLTVSPFLRSSSHLLVTSTLASFLPFYLPHLPTSPHSTAAPHLRLALSQVLPVLLEKLNDPKDRIHAPASTCVALLGSKSYEADASAGLSTSGSTAASGAAGGKGKEKEGLAQVWETAVKETLASKATRAKIEILKLLVVMRAETNKIPLKPWMPSLVDLLEDGDGSVRDQARESVVALLSPASTPAAARSELKKLLLARGVRKTISDNITHRIFGGQATPTGMSTPTLETPPIAPGEDAASASVGTGVAGAAPLGLERSAAATPAAADDVEVVYIASVRDLENEFASMAPHFEGKETELNWAPREKSLVRIRGMLRGQAFVQFPDAFMPSFRANALDGVAKTLLSLRTTVAQQACAVVQELAEYTGSAFDPCVEHLLPVLGKMAGFTKKIIAEKSQKALTAILTHTTCAPKHFIAHIMAATADKNVQTRQYGMSHLKMFCTIQGTRAKSAIESTHGGLEQFEAAIKKGLADVNPQVREMTRAAFWAFEAVWPTQGQALMGELDGMSRKQLEKANPNGADSGSAATGKAAAPRTRQPSASSAILAMKRAKAAEMANARAAADRAVTSPIPGSPSIPSAETVTSPTPATSHIPRSTSNSSVPPSEKPSPAKPLPRTSAQPLPRSSVTSPIGSGSPSLSNRTLPRPTPTTTPRPLAHSTLTSPRDPFGVGAPRSRSSSLARTLSHSPPSSRDSPTSKTSPLRQTTAMPPASIRSTASSSATSANATSNATSLRTPVQARHPLPAKLVHSPRTSGGLSGEFTNGSGSGIARARVPTGGSAASDESRIDIAVWSQSVTPDRPTATVSGAVASDPVDEARRAQAAQGISAAQQLLEFTHDGQPAAPSFPITPVRPSGSNGAMGGIVQGLRTPGLRTPGLRTPGLRTPTTNGQWEPWQDSPRTMSPKILKDLKARNSERSWWNKRKQHVAAATPLKSTTLSGSPTLEPDIAALQAGKPVKNSMLRLIAFSQTNKITLPSEITDEETLAEEKEVWETGRLFERLFEALMAFLQADKPVGLVEQGLILLWEMIENQWLLVEGHEDVLCDALFRLRACDNGVVLEATNAIVFLLIDVLDLHFLLTTLRVSLEKFISIHANDLEPSTPNPSRTTSGSTSGEFATPRPLSMDDDPGSVHVLLGQAARKSALTFGLGAMGCCVLEVPRESIELEARLFEPLVMAALRMQEDSVTARQAAHRLILAVQCVLMDDTRTLSLFPLLDATQRAICTYLMKQSKILPDASGANSGGVNGAVGGRGSGSGNGNGNGLGDGEEEEEEGRSLVHAELVESITKSAKTKREGKET